MTEGERIGFSPDEEVLGIDQDRADSVRAALTDAGFVIEQGMIIDPKVYVDTDLTVSSLMREFDRSQGHRWYDPDNVEFGPSFKTTNPSPESIAIWKRTEQ